MKKYTIVFAIVLLNASLLLVLGSNPEEDDFRTERLSRFLDEVSLHDEKAQSLIQQLQSINLRFIEFIHVKNNFSDRVREGENVWSGLNEEYQANIVHTWSAYSEHMKYFTLSLEEIMSSSQISLFYNFLLDELWYEGIVTHENTKVNESLLESSESVRSADTSEFIREYGRETFEKMMLEYDQDPDFPTKEDLVFKEPYQEKNVREIEPVFEEDPEVQYGLEPPWKGMERPPATTSSLHYFFEQQNLSTLHYFHLTLFPQMAEMLQIQ